MGALNSRPEDDKGLQLCRARKKFIRRALNGRCSFASAHIAYIEHLGAIGSALSQFVELDTQVEAFPCSPSRAISEQHANVENPVNQLSVLTHFQSNAMIFGGAFSRKIEEKPPVVATVEVTPPWDYFGIFHHADEQFSSQDQMGFGRASEGSDEIQGLEEEGMPELEDIDEKLSSHEIESEDEFEEPSPALLVRSFRNINTVREHVASEAKESHTDNVKETGKGTVKKDESSDLLPHGEVSRGSVHLENEDHQDESPVRPKDFYSSINDIKQLFLEASKSGKEVPQMLEVNKFHFRLVKKERGMVASWILRLCLSCGKASSNIQRGTPQTSLKYLTWHRTRSSHSTSSHNPLHTNSTDATNDLSHNLFDNSYTLSRSHASTLDRLYAWEKKLYDEVKAGQVVRTIFNHKCKILRQKESRGESADKTRAAVKDLHSRIQVAIHRINSISKKIEEIRDSELQPQLEEFIEGLRKMWETMAQCHGRQFHIMSICHIPGAMKIKMHPDTTIHLQKELDLLPSAFTKWITMQKAYLEAIDKWLFKCVSLPQNPTRRNKRMKPPPIRNCGPPIYMMCGAWLEMIDQLPVRGVVESVHALAAEVARFSPNRDKNLGDDGMNGDHRTLNLDRFQTTLAGFLGQLDKFAATCVTMFAELQEAIQEAKSNYERFKP